MATDTQGSDASRPVEGTGSAGGGGLAETVGTACYAPPDVFLLSNETPDPITIETCEGPVHLAPLEDNRLFTRAQFAEGRLAALRRRILAGELRLEEAPVGTGQSESFGETVFGVLVFVGVVASAVGVTGPWLGAVLALALIVMLVFVLARWRGTNPWDFFLSGLAAVAARLAQFLVLLAALVVAVGIPAVAAYYGTGIDEVARWRDGRLVVDPEAHALVTLRALQLGIIALASLLPALMFFQFRRERLLIIRKRMLHDVFRLDNRLKTIADLKARYGSQLDSLMDPRRRISRSPGWSGSCTPLIVATFAVTLGWIVILLDMSDTTGNPADAPLSRLISPDASAFSYAFLGAYFFAIQVVLRGYIRGDLTPKAYNTIAARVFVALILAWLVGSIFGDDSHTARIGSFLAGILPDTVYRWIRDKARLSRQPSHDDVPLTDLEGIDLYDRTRLAEEGITNVQALAHHNLVELMLNTRIPVPRLVDWVDQGVLYLHVVPPARLVQDEVKRLETLNRLRSYGIRTASDLIQAARYARLRGEEPRFLLRRICGEGDIDGPSRLEVALDVLDDDEWVGCIRAWRGIPPSDAQAELAHEQPAPPTQPHLVGVVSS